MSKKPYYTITTKEELTHVAYIEIHDSDSGSAREQQHDVNKNNEASFIS